MIISRAQANEKRVDGKEATDGETKATTAEPTGEEDSLFADIVIKDQVVRAFCDTGTNRSMITAHYANKLNIIYKKYPEYIKTEAGVFKSLGVSEPTVVRYGAHLAIVTFTVVAKTLDRAEVYRVEGSAGGEPSP